MVFVVVKGILRIKLSSLVNMWACHNRLYMCFDPSVCFSKYFFHMLFPGFLFSLHSTVPVTDPRVQQAPNRTLIEAAHVARNILT